MRSIFIISVVVLAAISLVSAYNSTQEAMIQGARLSWDLAKADTSGETTTFNTVAAQWNAWVRQWFGNDSNLLVGSKPIDLTKPVLIANNTTSGGIVHQIDGSSVAGPHYTTNDPNLLPEAARNSWHNENPNMGDPMPGI